MIAICEGSIRSRVRSRIVVFPEPGELIMLMVKELFSSKIRLFSAA